jgi:hypothetical protein
MIIEIEPVSLARGHPGGRGGGPTRPPVSNSVVATTSAGMSAAGASEKVAELARLGPIAVLSA